MCDTSQNVTSHCSQILRLHFYLRFTDYYFNSSHLKTDIYLIPSLL